MGYGFFIMATDHGHDKRISYRPLSLLWIPMNTMRADLTKQRALLMNAPKKRQFFNAIAEDWDELNRKVLGTFDLAAFVGSMVPQGCSLAVDLGCGTGTVLERMLERAQGVIGVDGSPRMLELCKRRFSPDQLKAGGSFR